MKRSLGAELAIGTAETMEGTWGKSPELWIAARRYNLHFVLYKPEEQAKFTVYFPHEVI
jgi:hypothetical protein